MTNGLRITAFDLAQRFVGMRELPGTADNPAILAMLHLDAKWPDGDEVPWCSAFVNYVCWLLRLPRSKSLRAKSWLDIGHAVTTPRVGFDIVILNRPPNPANGHVGFYAGSEDTKVHLLGGNQSNTVCVAPYDYSRIVGTRRLYQED